MASIFLQVVALLVVLYILQELHNKFMKKKKKLPPGPKGLPIIGNLHMIGKNVHQDLHKIAKKYGPIMSMRFGFVPVIVASSPHAAEQFLKNHDLIFASRPNNIAAKFIAYDQRNLTFGKYGPYWRNMRKLCTLELLSTLKINSFQAMRKQEVTNFVTFINGAASSGVEIDISAKLATLNTNMTCLMVFGKKYMDDEFDERGFKYVIQETLVLTATPNIGEFFPFLNVFDLQGVVRRMKELSKIFDEFFERIIDEHVQDSKKEKQTKDIVDTMMNIMQSGESEFEFDRRHVKAILLDMLIASMDTSSTAIDWIFTELLRHPKVIKKLQKELEQIVGMNRMVEESDLEKLEYLDMVIKEGFRLHPVAPLLIPHESIEDCTIDGFDIPKGSRLLVNTWAIGRDPEIWSEPEKFMPERFVGSNIDLRGNNFQLLPFGSGRRSCPGLQLGLTTVRLVLAQMVHCFDWKLPNGMMPNDLDMTEKFGLVMTRAQHLMVIPTYRLNV
ncbi:cytochrome P450 CYP736A12-like isoform X2 [Solanum tuberosum]|uniref:cytochrome P450 CYP736A12-like isoform X1 n=1 Tax=Solanum tuberosum TaxID=4113 RepID=UPI0003D2439E|nr:PREDICTED: cytochrome P450 CYP736A12-like isoform X1 [Solanum tuberosum]XP_006363550.1 PREDICTED: cytochrome P450 CYP736A12-like isoform X2 [Solanum tuberosum]